MKVYAVISSAKYDGSYYDDLEFICSTYERAQEICQSMRADEIRLDTKYRVEEHEVVE